MENRLFPIDIKTFNACVLPIIEQSYIWKGRPPVISHYKVFCAILYILRADHVGDRLHLSFALLVYAAKVGLLYIFAFRVVFGIRL